MRCQYKVANPKPDNLPLIHTRYGGKLFSYDPRTGLGKALTAAESAAGSGKLALTRWRAGNKYAATAVPWAHWPESWATSFSKVFNHLA